MLQQEERTDATRGQRSCKPCPQSCTAEPNAESVVLQAGKGLAFLLNTNSQLQLTAHIFALLFALSVHCDYFPHPSWELQALSLLFVPSENISPCNSKNLHPAVESW